MRHFLFLICCFLAVTPLLEAQQIISGRIGKPVEEGFLLVKRDSLKYAKTSLPLKDILCAERDRILVNIRSPLYLACISEPVTDRMIQNACNAIFDTGGRYPVMILLPQQITVYPDGSYTGLLEIQEYRNSIIGLSTTLPLEYNL